MKRQPHLSGQTQVPPSQRGPISDTTEQVLLPSAEQLREVLGQIDDAEFCILLGRFAGRLDESASQVSMMLRDARRRLEVR